MPALVTSLNAAWAADSARSPYALQGLAFDETASLRAALERQGYPLNGRITASYSFTIGDDGALIPAETRITAESDVAAETSSRPSRLPRRSGGDADTLNLASFLKPRIQLTPTDDSALFAQPPLPTSGTYEERKMPLSARAQLNAAGLYARNTEVIYHVTPLLRQVA